MAESSAKVTQPRGYAAGRYYELTGDRESFLMRARDLAALTVPYLFRESGANDTTLPIVPWESLGAQGVAHLAAKVIFSIFPPGAAPFKLTPEQQIMAQIEAGDPAKVADLKAGIDAGLSKVEKEFVDCFEQDGDRAALTVGMMKMLVGGTHGWQFYPDGKCRGISLDRFVNVRDPAGNLIEWSIWDSISWNALDDDIRDGIVAKRLVAEETTEQDLKPCPWVEVYTYGRLKKGKWDIWQECWGERVEGSERTLNPDALDYLFTPWTLLPGENYGRPYVELYEGDLQTVEGLTQTITEGSAAAARFLTFVRPGGLTSKKQVAEAENGAVLSGRSEDVTVPEANKNADFSSGQTVIEAAVKRLEAGFLMFSSVQRDAERVTAVEIKAALMELEQSLGGAFSQQAVTLQNPYSTIKLARLQNVKRVTPLPQGLVKVTMIGGFAALGRSADMDALGQWAAFLVEVLGATWMSLIMTSKPARNIAQRAAAALRVDTTGLLPTDEEMDAAVQQQATQQMLANPAAVAAINQTGQNLTQNQVADTNANAKLAAGAPPQAAA